MTTRTVSTELTPAQRQAFEEAVERHGKSFFANADLIWKTLLGADYAEAEECETEYEVICNDEWAAASTDLHDALHYAAVYGQDGPIRIFEVSRRLLPTSPKPTNTAEKEVGDG